MERVLIVGSTAELGRTEEVYSRGFAANGSKVCNFSWKTAAPILCSSKLSDKVVRKLGAPWIVYQANQTLIEVASKFKPTLTFVVAPNLVLPNTIEQLRQHGLAFVFFTDNPLDGHHTHSNAWVEGGLSLWDATFIWSKELVNALMDRGVQKAVFHAFCSDTAYHFPQKNKSVIHDVVFIGNWDDSGKRERFLASITDYRLGLWGSSDWNTRCQVKALHGRSSGMCSYEEIPEIMGSAHIGLNILRPQNEIGHNIRTFEIPACGTLMLSERSAGLLNLFAEDKEAVYFSTPEEVAQKVRYLLSNPAIMRDISEAGFQRAITHKIVDRVEEITQIYSDLKKNELVCLA